MSDTGRYSDAASRRSVMDIREKFEKGAATEKESLDLVRTKPTRVFSDKKNDADGSRLSSDWEENLNTGKGSGRLVKREKGPNRLGNDMKKDNASKMPVGSIEHVPTGKSKDIRSKYADLRVFRQPHCLIGNDERGKLSIVPEVMEEISNIGDTVNVIAIAGPYRSGKSYLLNRLAKASRGFPLGNTTKATTKGIWVWCLEHPKREDEVLMLLDTEGIGDVDKGDEENDNCILCLTTLLSGTFVYNMLGVADEKLLKSLSFVAQIANKIALSNTLQEDDLKSLPEKGFFFPSFVLCLRDFYLKMANGETPDSYFERCLKVKKGQGKRVVKHNTIRISILENFRNRKCFTIDRPAETDRLAWLEDLKESELKKKFLADAELFVEYMYSCKPKRLFDGSLLNGRMFSSLAEKYTESLSHGNLPCIDDALTIMSHQENRIALQKAVVLFKHRIESIQLPLPDDFELTYKQAQRDSLKTFREMAVLDDKQVFQKAAQHEMDMIKEKVVEKNRTFLKDVCSKELQSLYDTLIKPKVMKGDYFKPGGYKMYREDFARLGEKVQQRLPKADPNLLQICALEFVGRYRDQDEEILERADMTESQIKAEMDKQRAKLAMEKAELMKIADIKRKEEAKKIQLYKEEVSKQMEKEKQELKEKYEQMIRDWQKEKEDLESKLRENADLVRDKKHPTTVTTTQGKKPPMKETVFKTVLSFIPVVGPVAAGVYERYSSA